MMGAFDLSVVGLVLAVVTGIGSFLVGRHLREKRMNKRRATDRATAEAVQSRQVRRARERRQKK